MQYSSESRHSRVIFSGRSRIIDMRQFDKLEREFRRRESWKGTLAARCEAREPLDPRMT